MHLVLLCSPWIPIRRVTVCHLYKVTKLQALLKPACKHNPSCHLARGGRDLGWGEEEVAEPPRQCPGAVPHTGWMQHLLRLLLLPMRLEIDFQPEMPRTSTENFLCIFQFVRKLHFAL